MGKGRFLNWTQNIRYVCNWVLRLANVPGLNAEHWVCRTLTLILSHASEKLIQHLISSSNRNTESETWHSCTELLLNLALKQCWHASSIYHRESISASLFCSELKCMDLSWILFSAQTNQMFSSNGKHLLISALSWIQQNNCTRIIWLNQQSFVLTNFWPQS